MMEHPNDLVSKMQPLDELYWRDEILQVMYWYQGEGFGESVTVRDLQTFLPADEHLLATQMDGMVTEGYLVRDEGDASPPSYAFTLYGAREGARRFADEFAGLTGQAHGECGPDCPHCKDIPRDKCVHCSPS
jgi:hypothetical protein